MAIPIPVPAYTKESPIREFLMPKARITLYRGIIIELKGISIENTNKDSRNTERLVFVRHNFQPAILDKKMIKATDSPDIKTVLKSVCK
jgi:hypothetical protein